MINIDDFISTYEHLYFDDKGTANCSYVKIAHKTPHRIEAFIETKLNNGIVDKYTVAWKCGQLLMENDRIIIRLHNDGKNYMNGYGATIYANELDDYIQKIRDLCGDEESDVYRLICSSEIDSNIFEAAYHELCEYAPMNLGCVNIVCILYFLSKGKYPIYDSFAHKAARALLLDMPPKDIYLGQGPSKDNIKAVMTMYNEYRTLLKKLFGSETITRSIDRALWVYGHSNIKYADKKEDSDEWKKIIR